MDFKDITMQLIDSLLEHPANDKITINRDLGNDIFNIMLLMTTFYGPEMTYEKIKKLYEAI